ncbi:MAG: hypothetical protein CMJ26_07480 [Phycisphaerae bacterium]|nr:hypothetical protein [Phycisphaerae bacterium]
MKTHAMLGLGIASSLICGTAASGQFTFQGMDYRVVETNAVAGDFNWTIEFYLVLNSDERLDAVAGDGINDKRLATSGTFYQNPFGGPTSVSINPALYSSFPSLEFDSFVTVGAMDSTGFPYGNNALQTIGVDWANFEDNGGDVYTDNGLWFVTPDDTQGEPIMFTNQNCEDKYGVLVSRVTVFGELDSVYMGALFQGKDNTGTTWQATGELTVWYPTITDCNNNGVDDGCDIVNGSSIDANGNGIPDECEFPDCNGNGIDDNDDIANGTSADCNSNGTPDECEMPTGDCNGNDILDDCEIFDDCNDNGIPDECEKFSDCNGNGVPDECEDLQDWDDNGVPDACEDLFAYNTTQGIGYSWIDDAIHDSNDNDIIWVDAAHINSNVDVDYSGKAIDIDVRIGNVDGTSFYMHSGASLIVNPGSHLNDLRSGTSGTATVSTESQLYVDGLTTVYRDSALEIDSGPSALLNDVSLRMSSELGTSGDLEGDGSWTCAEGSAIYVNQLTVDGTLTGTVDIYGNLENRGTVRATDDLLVSNDVVNDNLMAIHRGILYVLGDLTNNGTILGEVDGGPGLRGGSDEPNAGDGMRVAGNYAAGENASILMPHPNWSISVGGNFDVAINDSAMFVMNEATLKLNGHDGEQFVEVMSGDYGPTEDALSPAFGCTYPIGSLNIAVGSHVVLTDTRENDCDDFLAEVIYTESLNVAAGATLNTNGYIIYASEVDNQGTIIGEDDIIIINPPVTGDLDGDGVVGILDILIVIAEWGPCSGACISDMNTDGTVDVLDLLVLIANWTP